MSQADAPERRRAEEHVLFAAMLFFAATQLSPIALAP